MTLGTILLVLLLFGAIPSSANKGVGRRAGVFGSGVLASSLLSLTPHAHVLRSRLAD